MVEKIDHGNKYRPRYVLFVQAINQLFRHVNRSKDGSNYPIFDKFEESEQNVTSVLTATVFWTGYFADGLPDNANGIIAVVQNNQQNFTYRIDGKVATFLGMEDLRDTAYDSMMLSTEYSTFDSEASAGSESRSRYTGVPVNHDHMSYSISVSYSSPSLL
jgi:hypothetical protein